MDMNADLSVSRPKMQRRLDFTKLPGGRIKRDGNRFGGKGTENRGAARDRRDLNQLREQRLLEAAQRDFRHQLEILPTEELPENIHLAAATYDGSKLYLKPLGGRTIAVAV